MRATRIFSGTIVLFLYSLAVHAGTTPYDAMIVVPETEVRSGKSPSYYPTSKLHKGDRVRVVADDGSGWLAISPPMPESFSWINGQSVELRGSNATVTTNETDVWVGSRLLNQPPTVRSTKVVRGTQLTVIGKAEIGTDGITWLPILPTVTEVRYVEVSAVGLGSQNQTLVSATTSVPPAFAEPKPEPTRTNENDRPLLREARLAEANSNFLQAAANYETLAKQTSDHDLSVSYLNHAQYLRNRVATNPQAPTAVAASNFPQPGNMDGRLIPAPTAAYGQPTAYLASQPAGQASSQYCYVADPCQTVRLRAPSTNVQATPIPATQAAASQPMWYPAGQLFRTASMIDGKTTYLLWTGNGQTPLYVTVTPGLNLEPLLYRSVQLYGPVVYRGDLRTNYMVVLQANVVQ